VHGDRLDFLVSNAAIKAFTTWDAMSIEDFDNLFETDVRGSWAVSRRACGRRSGAAGGCPSPRQRPMIWRSQQRFAEVGVEGLLRDKTREPGKPAIAAATLARGWRRPAAPSDALGQSGDGRSCRHFGQFGTAHLGGAQAPAASRSHFQALAIASVSSEEPSSSRSPNARLPYTALAAKVAA